MKKKLTLSIRKDLLDEAKKIATLRGKTLSGIIEEYFEYLVSVEWIGSLARELGLEPLEPVSPAEITKSRPKGFNASLIVREIREGRTRRISYDEE